MPHIILQRDWKFGGGTIEAVWHVSKELDFLVLVLPLISPASLDKSLNLF